MVSVVEKTGEYPREIFAYKDNSISSLLLYEIRKGEHGYGVII